MHHIVFGWWPKDCDYLLEVQVSWFVAAAVAGIDCQNRSAAERMGCSNCQKRFAVAESLIVAACNLAVAAEIEIGQTLSAEVESRSESQSAGSENR